MHRRTGFGDGLAVSDDVARQDGIEILASLSSCRADLGTHANGDGGSGRNGLRCGSECE